jgi:hypothetical protein
MPYGAHRARTIRRQRASRPLPAILRGRRANTFLPITRRIACSPRRWRAITYAIEAHVGAQASDMIYLEERRERRS